MKGKKGAILGMPKNMFYIVIAVLLFYGYSNGWFDSLTSGVGLDSSGTASKYDVTVSTPNVGVATDLGNNNWEILLVPSNLNSANNTAVTFTITGTRLDKARTNQGVLLTDVFEYQAIISDMKNLNRSTDASLYSPIQFISGAGNGFNVSVNGQAFATQNAIPADTTAQGTPASGAVVLNVEDFTTLNELAGTKAYDKVTITTIDTTAGTVYVNYMRTTS